jgi:YD repeat-containing protein
MRNKQLVIFIIYCILQSGTTDAFCQFFYKDIWNTNQLNKDMALLKSNGIKIVSIKSFESNGDPSQGFYCEKRIDKSHRKTETITRSNVTNQSLLTSIYNDDGHILQTTDSTSSELNRTTYNYDQAHRLIQITSFTRSDDDATGITEVHKIAYNDSGRLASITRLKNNQPFSSIVFKNDNNGNVIEEAETLSNNSAKKYFYYYDDKKNLTDVVSYNERARRLLPEYMYEYNQSGQIKQMVTTEEGGENYYTWKYTYNDQRLRETEKCINKERKLMGSVEYSYK